MGDLDAKIVSLISGEQKCVKKCLSYQDHYSKWNMTERALPNHLSVVAMFTEHVNMNPNNIAVSHGSQKMTYLELDERSNKLANLIKQECQKFLMIPSERAMIGIMMERSIDLLVSILAVFKANAIYVPIDPDYPTERIKFIIDDANIKFIITHENHCNEKINELNSIDICQIVALDSELAEKSLYVMPNVCNEAKIKYQDLAYAIYTSGSTGNPKGVLIEHRSLINYAAWINDYLNITPNDKFDCSSSISFDFTVTTTIVPLLYGACVVICDDPIKNDPSKYFDYLINNKISVMKLVPTYFNLLCDLNNNVLNGRLRAIILGGESACSHHIKKWLVNNKNIEIFNEYGPTETTVGVTVSIYKHGVGFNDITIGRPGHNVKIYILDDKLNQKNIGEIGELYISGVSLSRGYLNRQDLTDEKFINNPFMSNSEDYNRLYRTGDLACWQEDGTLKYLGRIDDQIKINGYRVELSEIEKIFNEFPGVNQTVVISKKNKNFQYLISYYTTKSNFIISEQDIKNYLIRKLPHYMVPLKFFKLDNFPLTINGKIDKKNLPALDEDKIHHRPDMNNTAIDMIGALREILGYRDVEPDANFFDLGMTSSLATVFYNELITKGYKFELISIYQYPTVNLLATSISVGENFNDKVILINETHNRSFSKRNFDRRKLMLNTVK